MRVAARLAVGLATFYVVGLIALQVGFFIGPHMGAGFPARTVPWAWLPATFLGALGLVVMGLVAGGLYAACCALAHAGWTESAVQWVERRLPKRPPPLSELHKDAKQDKERAHRFL